jgi:hypothetical protein
MLESENRGITQKESYILLVFGIPQRALSQRKKEKKKCASVLYPRAHMY